MILNSATNPQLRIVRRYRESGQLWPATARQIASWAIKEQLWAPRTEKLLEQCAAELARAMGQEYHTDPQGRTVRAKHAARTTHDGKQATFWADISTATAEHMRVAFQQRRSHIVGECKQLKADVDSYNDNKVSGAPIQLVLDFTADLAEVEAAEAQRRWSITDTKERQSAERTPEAVLA